MVIGPRSFGRVVRDVHQRLLHLGFPVDESEREGSFGASTQTAVRAFQQRRGLLVDGLVGPDTWRELVEASWHLGDRVLYLRSPQVRGDDVRDLQARLAALGFDTGRVDGIFGPRTETALKDFQRNYGLPLDGIVGESTVRALDRLPHLSHGEAEPVTRIREREALRRMAGPAGLQVVVDPASGDGEAGIVGRAGTTEAACTFAVARHLEAALAAAGVRVYVTRDAEQHPSDRERADLANKLSADLFISLHCAENTDPGAGGVATYYYGHERFSSEAGARLADLAQEAVRALGLTDARTHAKTFPILRETRMPAIQIDLGYLTNPEEEQKLADPDFQRGLGQALADAVVRFASAPIPA